MGVDKRTVAHPSSFINVVRGLLRSMRPKQWTKNGFVFAALLFDGKLFQEKYLLPSLIGFVVFCFLSSAVYLINDVADVSADRLHPTKRNRPIARGDVSPAQAITWAAFLALGSLAAAYALSPGFAIIGLLYFGSTLFYTFVLKHVVIVDVLVLALGFVLRVGGGAVLAEAIRFSPWMYVCMLLLALLLGFGKRRQELVELNGNASTRAILSEYSVPLLDQIISIVTAVILAAYSFYTFSAPQLPANHTMMLTIPFVMYGVFRYLYLVQVKGAGGAPDELLLTDRPMQIAIALWALSAVVVLYFLPQA
ncbi:MAG TPA: decaprenyl-phosphate phosphoribosyltransferase [Anaerolineae bacterium]